MLKKVTLQNIFGIYDEQILDFEVKQSKDIFANLSKGIKVENNIKIMITPLLIAKNASGKSSILKAIKFADKINSFEDLKKLLFSELEKEVSGIMNSLNKFYNALIKDMNNENPNKWVKIKNWHYLLDDYINYDEYLGFYRDQSFDFIKKYVGWYIDDLYAPKFVKYDNQQMDLNKINEFLVDFKNYIINERPIQLRKFLLSHLALRNNFENIEKKSIKIFLEYSDKNNKKIEIGNILKFNDKKDNIENIFNKIMNDLIYKIKNHPLWEIIKKIKINFYNNIVPLEIKKNRELFKKDYGFHKSFFLKNNSNSNIFYIDDKIIIENINKIIGRIIVVPFLDSEVFALGDAILKNIINFLGIEFVEEFLIKIDNNISHIVENKNGFNVVLKNGRKIGMEILSFGTLRILVILNKIVDIKKKGKKNSIILIDEIENSFNLSLINFIIALFKNEKFNKKNTIQLILTSHNPSIIEKEIILPHSTFIHYDEKFRKPLEITKRTEQQIAIFKSKNYGNPFFWNNLKNNKEYKSLDIPTNTINSWDIDDILDYLEEKL